MSERQPRTYPVNEIFYSIQGEGYHAGRPAVFVRFSGCNLKCPYCDTQHASHQNMTAEEILEQVNGYPARFVVLTGGEPSLCVDDALVGLLHSQDKYIAAETNGTHALPDAIDWVTLSPKTEVYPHVPVVQPRANEVKVVYTNPSGVEGHLNIPADHYFLQPCDTGNARRNQELVQSCIQYCKAHPQWRISLQLHKIMNIP
ncbi:MAG: radical SAM protein [Bacteroidaceae bacterium]|nr:radical SAM protein [Bacteroidaceae bacterium]